MPLSVGVGDRIRLTAGGKTKDGEHRLSNGSMFTIQGFTKRGDIDRRSRLGDRQGVRAPHARLRRDQPCEPGGDGRQGLHRPFERFLPGDDQRTAYVAVTRGKEQALIFTDDKDGLFKAMSRPDDPLSATEVAESQKKATPVKRVGPVPCHSRCLGRTLAIIGIRGNCPN